MAVFGSRIGLSCLLPLFQNVLMHNLSYGNEFYMHVFHMKQRQRRQKATRNGRFSQQNTSSRSLTVAQRNICSITFVIPFLSRQHNSSIFSFSVHLYFAGYGYITPQTPAGQILCIFVSLLGIPITLLAFKSDGELIAKWVTTIINKFEKKILKRSEPKQMKTKSAVILFLLMMLLIVVNGLMLMNIKAWSVVEGVYFWFITFTTIGFGDYVIREPQRIKQLYVNGSVIQDHKQIPLHAEGTTSVIFAGLFVTCYYILSLCIVSSVLNSIMAAIEERKCRTQCPGCVPRKTQDHVDNEQYNTAEQRETNVENEQFSVNDF